MRVGIMLRTLDEKFGIGMYTRYILDPLLGLDCNHEYVLFYTNEEHIGKYGHYRNVTEMVVKAPNVLLWDQVAVPRVARRAKLDLLYHTKFTIPFLTDTKTLMRLAGSWWFTHPELTTNRLDLEYIKMVMPWYCRKADALIANSNLTRDDFINILKVPPEKIYTIYNGINPIFRPIEDRERLNEIKEQYGLPDRFILTVGRFDPRKNVETVFRAFTQCRDAGDLKLVAVGKDSWKYRQACQMDELGHKDNVFFPGYVGHEDLPYIYNLATAFIFPSVYEEFGNPLVEAMACGCPAIVSNTGALPEVAGGAAILADPFNADAIAAGIDRITGEPGFREELAARGLQRAKDFDLTKIARETLAVFEKVAQ